MAIKGYCGKCCSDCMSNCSLDKNIPCSPDCENLTKDGDILIEKCLNAKCEEVKYIFNTLDKTDEEIIEKYGKRAKYPYL